MKAVILLSGGMDSLVTAAIAARECEQLYFLHVNYGQRTEQKELECFQHLVDFYQPAGTLVTSIDYLRQIGGSSLTDRSIQVSDYSDSAEMPSSYVSFRNAHFLAIAVSWAEVISASRIYIGAVEEDSSGYPDCRQEFYDAYQKVINLGTGETTKIEIMTPVISLNKAEIIKKGRELNAPFQFSWSCYRDNEIACGTCDSCVLRLRAFKKAGLTDPLPYAVPVK